MAEDTPYDPYVPRSGEPQAGGQNKTDMLREDIGKTVQVMKKNIEDIQDRGARINELEDKTNNLAESAQHFRRGANRVRKQMWWKDMKMRVCLIVGIIVLLLVIIVPAVVATR